MTHPSLGPPQFGPHKYPFFGEQKQRGYFKGARKIQLQYNFSITNLSAAIFALSRCSFGNANIEDPSGDVAKTLDKRCGRQRLSVFSHLQYSTSQDPHRNQILQCSPKKTQNGVCPYGKLGCLRGGRIHRSDNFRRGCIFNRFANFWVLCRKDIIALAKFIFPYFAHKRARLRWLLSPMRYVGGRAWHRLHQRWPNAFPWWKATLYENQNFGEKLQHYRIFNNSKCKLKLVFASAPPEESSGCILIRRTYNQRQR